MCLQSEKKITHLHHKILSKSIEKHRQTFTVENHVTPCHFSHPTQRYRLTFLEIHDVKEVT